MPVFGSRVHAAPSFSCATQWPAAKSHCAPAWQSVTSPFVVSRPHAAPVAASAVAAHFFVTPLQMSPAPASQVWPAEQSAPAPSSGAHAAPSQKSPPAHGAVAEQGSPLWAGASQRVAALQKRPCAHRSFVASQVADAASGVTQVPQPPSVVVRHAPPLHCEPAEHAAPSARLPVAPHAAGCTPASVSAHESEAKLAAHDSSAAGVSVTPVRRKVSTHRAPTRAAHVAASP